MTETPARRPDPPPSTGGLTSRDLQRAIFLVFGLLAIYHLAAPLTTLLLFFLLVFILAAVMNPAVVRMERYGVPRIVTALLLAVLLLAVIGGVGWLLVKPLTYEVTHLFGTINDLLQRFTEFYNQLKTQKPQLAAQLPTPQDLAQQFTPSVSKLAGQVGRYTMNVAVAVLSIFLLLVLVVYTVAHPAPLIGGLLSATPEMYRSRMENALRRILEQLKNWAVGSLILGVIVGTMCGVGLRIIGVPYALLFGVIAGIGEMVPNIGPILSAVPPAVVALGHDPMQALWVVLLFAIVQQLENNLIVPLVMGKSLDLHPISVTFTVLVMGALFGLLGAILAVPVCAILKVCWEEFYLIPRRTDTEALTLLAEDIVRHDSPDPRDETPVEKAVERVAGDRHTDPPAPRRRDVSP